MAGSYEHCVNAVGQLYPPEALAAQLENGGDVYEAVQEMYGMIWWLAAHMETDGPESTADLVVEAQRRYRVGLKFSPGVMH
jgi:hypothetical protein